MKTPCRMCNYYTQTSVGHRTFIGCSDEEKKKGFIADDYWYRHECSNQDIREKCKSCSHSTVIYCNSVMAFDNGECIDYKIKEK